MRLFEKSTAAQHLSAYEYWSTFHSYVPNWGPIALMLCAQRSGQGASERMHQVVKRHRHKGSNRQSSIVTAARSELHMHIAREKFMKQEALRAAKGTDAVKVLGLVCESMAERAIEAKNIQDASKAANALANLKESEDFDDHDDDGDDKEREEADNDIHAAAVGEGEYGGIHEGDEDDVISALLALAEA